MSTQDNGGPAFPFAVAVGGAAGIVTNEELDMNGLSMRDYFAAKVMHGAVTGHISYYGHESNHWQAKDIASYAYELADAMLEARKQ